MTAISLYKGHRFTELLSRPSFIQRFYLTISMKTLILLTFFALYSSISIAQQKGKTDSIYIHGRVVEKLSNRPIEDASIMAINTQGDIVSSTKTVDYYKLYGVDGGGDVLIEFSLAVPNFGNYTLLVQKDKFLDLSYPITVPEKQYGKRTTLYEIGDLSLERVIELGEATVKASKVMMLIKGDTIIYNADAFQLSNGSLLDKLIEQLPGVSLKNGGQILVNGEFVSSLLIDGKDFFNGDAAVALRNLPAYAVNKVKVYRRGAEDSYLTMKDTTDRRQDPLVMDVRLRKDYHSRWLGNISLGGGTHSRYNLRGFAMHSSDILRFTAYGRLNNVGDTRRPTEGDTWSIEDFSTSPTIDKEGGADIYWQSLRSKAYMTASLKGGQQIETIGSGTMSHHYLTDGTSYDGLEKTIGDNRSHSFEYNGRFVLPLRKVFIEFKSLLEYQKTDQNTTSQSALLKTHPSAITIPIDSVRSPIYAPYLISDSQSKDAGMTKNLTTALGGLVKFVSPLTGNTITLDTDASFYDGKASNHYLGDRFTWNVSDRMMKENRASLPSQTYSLGTKIDYEISLKAFRWKLSYGYSYLYTKQDRDISFDIINSYSYNARHNRHNLQSDLEWIKDGHILLLRLPLSFEKRTANDTRATHIQKHYTLFTPSFTWLSPFGLYAYYNLSVDPQKMSQLFDITDTYNMQQIYKGNPHLKPSQQHTFELNYSSKAKKFAQAWHANTRYSIGHNEVVYTSLLNTATGVYTLTPKNVSGNYLVSLDAGYSRSLDTQNHWMLSSEVGAWIQHQSYFTTTSLTNMERGSSNSENFKANLRLTWRLPQLQINLKTGVQTLSATNNRANHYGGTDWVNGILLNYNLPYDFQINSDFTLFLRSGYSLAGIRHCSSLWNASISKSFGKHLGFRLDAYDLLHQLNNIERIATASYWQEKNKLTLPKYFMLNATWIF